MITIKNVKTQGGSISDIFVRSSAACMLDAKEQLLSLPALIDVTDYSGVLPGTSDGDWEARAKELLASGITTVCESQGMPPETAKAQREQVNSRLKTAKMPLSIQFFCDGTKPANFNHIGKSKAFFKGIKTSMDLANIPLPPYENALERIFQIAAQEDIIIAICLLQDQKEAALAAVKLALKLTEKYSAQLCLQHVRTRDEIALIQKAKEQNLLVYAQIAYQHLFINDKTISEMTLDALSHFLPTLVDQDALWTALNSGIIDLVGSGSRIFPSQDPALAAGLWLPSMLTAYLENKLRLDTLVAVTRVNAENIFRLPPSEDIVLVDLKTSRSSDLMKKPLLGWPVHVIAQGELITL